jgi:hypothetical protein
MSDVSGATTPAQDTPQTGQAPTMVSSGEKPISSTAPAEGSPTPAAGAPQAVEQKPAVPEKYNLKLPDGALLGAGHVEKVASFAKERGLSEAQAQALLERENETVSTYMRDHNDAFKKQTETWVQELTTDKEFGGEQLNENGQLAYRAASQWFGEEFVDLIKQANLNHHPMLFRGLVRLGRAMADDKLVMGAHGGMPVKSTAEVFYGKQE